ncbi:alkyl hydroperoxide reductase/ Thiol specific antioxidant/ Mal allergen [Erwinia tracheiphila PSU-1]|nr:alkyl hydroperoxide reductase/ Thiol specific antioxidant/ Mal allergen [Erwinia tracheiphila PSU-1]
MQKGPVVLYFFPAAFSAGCTVEAHDFAEATDSFTKLGATVLLASLQAIPGRSARFPGQSAGINLP